MNELEVSFDELCTQLIHKALINYELGQKKSNEVTLDTAKYQVFQLINYELFNLIDSRLSNNEKSLLHRVNQERSQALNTARQGDMVTAEQLMEKLRNTWDINLVSAEVNLLYTSFQLAAEAYLDYRRGDFEQAWSHITEAIITDAVLETEYGYKILFAHRLHLVQNLIRSEGRSQRTKNAIELGSQLLAYLEGKSENLPFPAPWDRSFVTNLPPEIIAVAFSLVIDEIALILATKNRQDGRELWEIIIRHIDLEVDEPVGNSALIYSWLRIKQALFNSNITNAIELISEFLAAGRDKAPLLWYATVIDLVAICDQLHLPNSSLVKQTIVNDAADWQDFPNQFLNFLKT